TGSSRRCRSRPRSRSCDRRRGAVSRSGHGDRCLGPGIAHGGADHDDRGLEARRPHPGIEAAQYALAGPRREVQRGAGAGRIDHARRTGRRAQLPVHRPPGASPAGAMRSLSRALATLAAGFLALDALLFLYSGLSPGRPERIVAVLEALRAADMAATVEWCEARPASREALERVHPASYLDGLERLALQGGGVLDADTAMSGASWDAAVAAAGVALGAVERGIATGTAFGATRPPGHHALAARAMGFCLINNAVVAARHAQQLGKARVLIVDWDVHH